MEDVISCSLKKVAQEVAWHEDFLPAGSERRANYVTGKA